MIRIVTRWCVLGVMFCVVTTPASAQLALRRDMAAVPVSAAAPLEGQLRGIVRDDRGHPISGAVVSALGSVSVFAVSDTDGRFSFRTLPAGPYLVRAHLQGYLPERGRVIQVTGKTQSPWTIALTRLSGDKSPSVLAAGVGPADPQPPAEGGDDHGEVAWRMRHAPRSILKDAEQALGDLDAQPDQPLSLAGIGHAVGAPARLASALFADVPLNTQINFLTTTSFDHAQDLFLPNGSTVPIAYVTVGAPVASGEWTIRGAATEGEIASWIVAGSYKRASTARHQYEAGLSYSTQRYLGGDAEALSAMRDGSRNVGAMYAYDSWSIAPRITVDYGGRYASYDYLSDRGLFSPTGTVTVRPFGSDPTKLRASVSHRESAPGADEFLPPATGVWIPPQRTFSSVSPSGFQAERLDHIEVAAERAWVGDVVLGVRVFRQHVDDQLMTLFALPTTGAASAVGHYQVGSAGDVDAQGWSVGVSRRVADGMRASVDYTQSVAQWHGGSADEAGLTRIAPDALRGDERIRDLTASVEAVVAQTATRVFVVYKVNDRFAGADARPSPGSRFDLQVNQALPFLNFTNAQWEMLVAVRTLFHDDLLDGSVYDELLVVRAPKRVLGGVTVRF